MVFTLDTTLHADLAPLAWLAAIALVVSLLPHARRPCT